MLFELMSVCSSWLPGSFISPNCSFLDLLRLWGIGSCQYDRNKKRTDQKVKKKRLQTDSSENLWVTAQRVCPVPLFTIYGSATQGGDDPKHSELTGRNYWFIVLIGDLYVGLQTSAHSIRINNPFIGRLLLQLVFKHEL